MSSPPSEKTPFDPAETIWNQWPPFKRSRRFLRSFLYRFPDTGFLGLTPLRTHILICGYQRSGTTLLLAMMEYALPAARHFGKETSGWRTAAYSWRNHPVLISKVPNDLFRLHQIRNFYSARKANLRILLMVRDPRDVLTSRHVVTGPDSYFQDIAEWRKYHAYIRLHKNQPDVLLVRYEDLVADTPAVQRTIDAFTGEPSQRPFDRFHEAARKDFDTAPLNGVRPVSLDQVGRWRLPKHRQRMEQILREVPDLPEILIELGYESDSSWIQLWRNSLTT